MGIDDKNSELIIAEYNQASEEVRYRDRILHNSYYLLIISFAAFLGSLLNLINSTNPYYPGIVTISIAAAGSFAFLSTILYIYNEKRLIAMAARDEIEDEYTKLNIQRATHPNFDKDRQLGTKSEGIKGAGPYLISHIVILGSSIWLGIGIFATFRYIIKLQQFPSLIFTIVICILYFGIFIHKLPDIHPDFEEGENKLSPEMGQE